MKDNFPYPEFVSPLMKLWLQVYKFDKMGGITKIGLFDWRFRPNKHNLEKSRRIPALKTWETLIDSSFQNSIYFLEINTDTLHVYESSGISLGGQSIAKEFVLTDNQFEEKKVLLKMIR
jgi:hypothetical protein